MGYLFKQAAFISRERPAPGDGSQSHTATYTGKYTTETDEGLGAVLCCQAFYAVDYTQFNLQHR